MSRYHSPYAARRSTPRWPWLFACLIVAALSATGVVLVRAGVLDVQTVDVPGVDRLTGQDPGVPTDDAAAMVATTATPTINSVPAETIVPASSPVASATAPVAAAPTKQAAPDVATPATPSLQPSVEIAESASPVQVVEAYAARWSAGDYDGLYDLLSADAQKAIARNKFIERYEGITDRAGLTSVKVSIIGEPNLQSQVPIKVEMESGKVGPIVEENAVPLVKEDGSWKVAWTPSLIFRDLGTDGCVDYVAEKPKRGAILDRDGDPLAYDGPISEVGIVPGEIENEASLLRDLSTLLEMSEDDIKAAYVNAEPEWFVPLKKFPESRSEELLNQIAPLKGARVQPGVGRVYPLGAKAAHVTGYISRVTGDDLANDESGALAEGDWVGRTSLEAGANDLLTGKPGGRLTVNQCETWEVRKEIASRKPIPAKDIVLTIDRDLQLAVDKALSDGIEGGEKGSAVIIDPRNGAVLALVSHPTFDPNGFILGFSEKDGERLGSETLKPLLDRAADARYPTGSIFKAITMAAAMEHLGYTADTPIDCPAQYAIPGTDKLVDDWVVEEGVGAQGTLSLHQALVQSCNTVFYQIGVDLDDKDEMLLPEMARAFGLGQPTNIPSFPETAGIVPDPAWKLETVGDYWATGDAVNLAIGQGYLLATPLQMANAYAAIANGGTLLQPYLVSMTRDVGGSTEKIGKRTVIRELPLKKATITALQNALRDQTSNQIQVGSSRVFGDFDWPIAGKTGTAQNNVGPKPHAWFAAFGPYGDTATIASVVMVESVGEAVSFAAPVTRTIYEAYLKTDLPESKP
ncbi:MAG: penicillin-binding transpeptidase domain-containing protein [Chloroflexota bacterium]|nr:penicillin-binding transpeptidase domain-containing protein [Chloroflexota bacterium]